MAKFAGGSTYNFGLGISGQQKVSLYLKSIQRKYK